MVTPISLIRNGTPASGELPPRERILDAAEELFQGEGIQRVGVQAIAEKAGTTKITFILEGAQVSNQNGSIDHVPERVIRIVTAILDRPAP